MRKDIIGRKEALHQLERCEAEKEATLLVVTGRRRIGKTFLINNYFNNEFDFKLTGDFDAQKEEQLTYFINEYNRKTGKNEIQPSNRINAFEMLRKYIDGIVKEKKKIIFFDEFPWLDNHANGFLNAFVHFWNDYLVTVENLLFIICGSASSWIEDKIIKNKGGLYNRHFMTIKLEQFTLKETEEYLLLRGIEWSRYDIALAYMIFGGVPYYLRLLDSSKSLTTNIDELFFKKNASLADEFALLFRTLFSNSSQYKTIVELLSDHKNGLTRDEIAKKLSLLPNGDLTEKLENLEITGFLKKYELRNGRKRVAYRLSDYFTMFYLRFVAQNKIENFWSKSMDNQRVVVWKGLMFETLCFDNIEAIKKHLGIGAVITNEFSWSYHGDEDTDGTQIDMLIERKDRVTNICEMKFVSDLFSFEKDDYLKLSSDKETYRKITNSKHTLETTLITTYGLKKGKYSNYINNVITLDDLFE